MARTITIEVTIAVDEDGDWAISDNYGELDTSDLVNPIDVHRINLELPVPEEVRVTGKITKCPNAGAKLELVTSDNSS